MGGYSPIGRADVVEATHLALDVNSGGAATASFDISSHSLLIYQGLQASGTFSTAVLRAQCSVDDTNWNDISGTDLTGPGVVGEITVASRFFRIVVQTPEGGAGTADIIVQAK